MPRKRKRRKQRRTNASVTVEFPDPRATFAQITAKDGVPVTDETFAIVVEPIRLDSGDMLMFQSPFVPPFYLMTAKAYRDRAEPRRLETITATATTPDGTLRPKNAKQGFDALEGLALAVIVSAAAIESHVNDMIGRLPDDAMVEVPTRLSGKTVAVMRNKAAMDWLPISDKLSRAAPLLHGADSIKGTVAWQKYKRLFRIRNSLVHPRREAVNDPEKPSAFGRLLGGEGSRAPEDAADVIEALEPGYLPAHVRDALGLA